MFDLRKFFRAHQRHFLAVLVLLLVGGGIYANSLNASFQFDDEMYIVRNPAVRHITDWPGIWQNYNTRFILGLSFALNYKLGGLDVFGYHCVNVFIHIANAVLVYFFVLGLFSTPYHQNYPLSNGAAADSRAWFSSVPFFAALIFLVHPIQTQAVILISQRSTSLAVFFYLLTLVLYIKGRVSGQGKYLGLAWGTTVLAMFTKEMCFTLPVMLVVLEGYFFEFKGQSLWQRLRANLPFLLTLLIIPTILFLEKGDTVTGIRRDLSQQAFAVQNILTAASIVTTHARLLLFPVNQNVDYAYPLVAGLTDLRFLAALALILFLITVGALCYRRQRLVSFCMVWYFLATSIETTASAFSGKDFIFEHWLYLAVVGYAVWLAVVTLGIVSQPRRNIFLVVVLAAALGFMTVQRNKVWQTPLTLWQDAVRKSPGNDRVHDNLAAVIVFDCDLRLMALGDKIVKENAKIHHEIGKTPVIGFFTNGEQCFLGDSSACHVNYTITALGISNNLMTKR